MTKVSIITPFYNSEKYLAESIESALSQTWSNKEIILVDDGSTDNSLSIAKSYESKDVKLISIKNSGQCAATNIGLRASQGDFIQFLDADDLLHPEKIASQLKVLKNDTKQVAIGPWARFTDDVGKAIFFKEKIWKSANPQDYIRAQWNGGGMMANSAYLMSREISDKAGYYNESLNYNNDFEYFTRVALASSQILFCEDSKSYYRSEVTSSLSQRRSYEAALSEYYAKKISVNHLLTLYDNQLSRQSCASAIFSFLYNLDYSYKDLFNLGVSEIEKLSVKSFNISQKKLNMLSIILGWKKALIIHKLFYHHQSKLMNVE